jgi:hypothetical protein
MGRAIGISCKKLKFYLKTALDFNSILISLDKENFIRKN